MSNITTKADLKKFLEKYPTREFKKGEIIIFQNEKPQTAFLVIEGIVKAYNISVDGDEKPVAFYDANSIFPGAWLYGKIDNSAFYYEAFTSYVVLSVVPKDEFVAFIKTNPELLFMELDRYVSDKLGSSMRLNALEYSKARDKLLYTLHYLALNYGHATAPHKVEIKLSLTHQDFANLTGLTRETAATELNKLKKIKIINYGKHSLYSVNLKSLVNLLHDSYITDMDDKTE
jgi:CRP/FNR family cyclic AMP-dependent transcriptional regulator